ncbi:hypothetical protein [Deinococcus hopiensis]|uniref:Uncharacterized protein n=1 Tax=Deinococcus hopiensis KR-140 TaxID=695939 RepID=A0A1W1VUH1_9DEIO|nr:hypothetical protein [Deinococcus hopiensis]SMB97015.1 hypothetical protein SAMN00790413_06292 [Deinococcus hopiensis KR-140]
MVSVTEVDQQGSTFTFAPGTRVCRKEDVRAQLLGASVGALHGAGNTFKDPGGRFGLDGDHRIGAPLAPALPLASGRPDDAAYPAALGARARARLEELASRA